MKGLRHYKVVLSLTPDDPAEDSPEFISTHTRLISDVQAEDIAAFMSDVADLAARYEGFHKKPSKHEQEKNT